MQGFYECTRVQLVAAFVFSRQGGSALSEAEYQVAGGCASLRACRPAQLPVLSLVCVQAQVLKLADHPLLLDVLAPMDQRRLPHAWPSCMELMARLLPARGQPLRNPGLHVKAATAPETNSRSTDQVGTLGRSTLLYMQMARRRAEA